MRFQVSNILDRVRRPEYTGQNRCTPCTVVNLAIAVVLAGSVVVIGSSFSSFRTGVLLGGFLFVLSVGSIYARGYLVPGTPRLTKTYFPDWVLGWFDKEPTNGRETLSDDVDVEQILQQAGAVTECEHEDDLCLTDGFRTAWNDRIAELRNRDTTRSELATVLDVDPERLSFQTHGDAFVAQLDDRQAGQWESHGAFLADVAAAREFRAQVDGWSDIPVQDRSRVLSSLRLFLEQCPACDGHVTLGEEVVESCCRSIDVVAVTCQDCGARLFEVSKPS